MIGGGTQKKVQFSQCPQRTAGRRAHAAGAEEDGKDSIEDAAAVVRTVQPRCVCVCVGEMPRPWCAKCNHGAYVGKRA